MDETSSFHASMAIQSAAQIVCAEQTRPSILWKPKLYPDGDMWCALYGDDLQSGFAAFGETADAAMRKFDKDWNERKLPSVPQCNVCGEHHERAVFQGCKTGDGA